jgi:hypothetical protein
MDERPALTKHTSVTDFNRFYWLKQELLVFCRHHQLPVGGSKAELAERIRYYLSTGRQMVADKNQSSRPVARDSDALITLETPVVHYRNDAKTRAFFVAQVGKQFRFNHYLRAFAQQINDGRMTYGDLVIGYRHSLENKKTTIDPQFEYNQFQRDFHKHHPSKSQSACLAAWHRVKKAPGDNSYQDYLRLDIED